MKDGKVEESGNKARQTVTIRHRIDAELALKIVKMIKEKLKLQATIRGDKVRVSGKSRDDLQRVIGMLARPSPGYRCSSRISAINTLPASDNYWALKVPCHSRRRGIHGVPFPLSTPMGVTKKVPTLDRNL